MSQGQKFTPSGRGHDIGALGFEEFQHLAIPASTDVMREWPDAEYHTLLSGFNPHMKEVQEAVVTAI